MYGIKWFKNSDYYKVRGYLLKNGFRRTDDYGYYDVQKTKGWCVFDNGTESIRLECTLKINDNGKLVCDKVTSFYNKIYDNCNMNTKNRALYESIMKGISKSLKSLNESAFVMNTKNMSYIAEFLYLAMNGGEYTKLFNESVSEHFMHKDMNDIFNELYWCNVESVNYRYGEESQKRYTVNLSIPEYRSMNQLLAKVSDVQIYKFFKCWHYQSEEKDSLTCELIGQFIERFHMFLCIKYDVPNIENTYEYESATWD